MINTAHIVQNPRQKQFQNAKYVSTIQYGSSQPSFLVNFAKVLHVKLIKKF